MRKLKFPVFGKDLPEAKSLSMDDFVRFLMVNRKYYLNREAHEEWKRDSIVDVPFVLK